MSKKICTYVTKRKWISIHGLSQLPLKKEDELVLILRGAELLVFKTKSDQIAIWFDFGPVSALRFHPVNHSFFLPDSLISCNKVFSISQPWNLKRQASANVQMKGKTQLSNHRILYYYDNMLYYWMQRPDEVVGSKYCAIPVVFGTSLTPALILQQDRT